MCISNILYFTIKDSEEDQTEESENTMKYCRLPTIDYLIPQIYQY